MPHYNKKMLSFFLTTKCNLCCRYCYNASERNRLEELTLPVDIAIAGVDWYFANNPYRHIRFYGPGEPTQEYSSMKLITEYAKSHVNGGDRVTVEIQTNGVFDHRVREWMLENANIVWISFDGMPSIQNYNRPLNPKYSTLYLGKKTSSIIEDNIKWFHSNTKKQNIMIGVRATITDKNVNSQIELVDYFYSLGIRYVWTDPIFCSVGEKPVCKMSALKEFNKGFDMNAYVENYIRAYKYASSKGMFYGSFLAVNFDGTSCYHCRSCSPLSAPHLTTDGYISACDMPVFGSKAFHMSPLIVGRWNDSLKRFDIDYNKVHVLEERKSINIPHCKDCPVIYHCGGYCLGEVLNETGSLNGKLDNRCNAIKKLYAALGTCNAYEYMHP